MVRGGAHVPGSPSSGMLSNSEFKGFKRRVSPWARPRGRPVGQDHDRQCSNDVIAETGSAVLDPERAGGALWVSKLKTASKGESDVFTLPTQIKKIWSWAREKASEQIRGRCCHQSERTQHICPGLQPQTSYYNYTCYTLIYS